MSNLQAAATHLGSQLLYADSLGYMPYLSDLAENYLDDDFDRFKITIWVTRDAEADLLPRWREEEEEEEERVISLNEQHFMEALSKILHPTGASRNVDRDRFWDSLMDNENEYAWMRLDSVDAANVLEVVLFGKVIY